MSYRSYPGGVSDGPGTLWDVRGTPPANLSSAWNILGEAGSHFLVCRECLKMNIMNILGNWSRTTFPEDNACKPYHAWPLRSFSGFRSLFCPLKNYVWIWFLLYQSEKSEKQVEVSRRLK